MPKPPYELQTNIHYEHDGSNDYIVKATVTVEAKTITPAWWGLLGLSSTEEFSTAITTDMHYPSAKEVTNMLKAFARELRAEMAKDGYKETKDSQKLLK